MSERGHKHLDPAMWTADERTRLVEFVRILLEWEAARPHTDAITHDHEDQRRDQLPRIGRALDQHALRRSKGAKK
jgi:hypothetical protein